jgi:NitT/TauT family transport system substrate-binding protein
MNSPGRRLHFPHRAALAAAAWLLGLAIALGACAPAAPAARAPAPPTPGPPATAPSPDRDTTAAAPSAVPPLRPRLQVKLGGVAIGAEAGYFIAMDRGYFAAEGLDVEFETFQRGAELIPPLATGEIQFGSMTLDGSLFNAAQRDIELKIVNYNSLLTPTHYTAGVVMRQDHLDSGRYREPRDLKGMTIALSSLGSTPQLFTERILARGGLTADDVTFTLLSFPDMVPALANKAIDAAWLTEPLIAVVEAQAIGKDVFPSGDAYPGAVTMVLVVSPGFAHEHPEAVRRFVVAHLRGQRDYYRAVMQDQGGKDEVFQILARHTAVKDLALYPRMGMHAVDPNGGMDARILDDYQDYFVERGTQQRKLDLSKVIDDSYVNAALDRLGRLQ